MSDTGTPIELAVSLVEKRQRLESYGFTCGERDPRINTNYLGRWMVVESHEDSELPTEDGSNGPWCIVGDDLDVLVNQAYKVWADEYEL